MFPPVSTRTMRSVSATRMVLSANSRRASSTVEIDDQIGVLILIAEIEDHQRLAAERIGTVSPSFRSSTQWLGVMSRS